MKKIIFCITMLTSISFNNSLYGQIEPDDIAIVSDDFEVAFYESMKQKGIQNHDKALESLAKCLKLRPENDVVLFEMGKNHLQLKNYKDAYDFFEKASKINDKNRWYFHGMYDVCYQTQDFLKAIDIVKILIPFDSGYREDLASLYMKTQQFDKALAIINELNATVGKSEKRELYKAQILNTPQNQDAEAKNLLDLISKSPLDESNYNALILLYTKTGKNSQAIAIADKLEKIAPNSDWAQVTLFKKYLSEKDGKKAVLAMNQALGSPKIDNKIKHRILNEFLIFVKDYNEFDADLENAVGYFKNDSSVKVAKEIGKFFQNKENWSKAIQYYEIDIKANPNDLEVQLLALECYLKIKDYSTLTKKAETLLELFPLQPQPYLYAASGHNNQKNFKKAKEILESGIDYIIDNPILESEFYAQFAVLYGGLGDTKNRDNALLKSKSLLQKK